MTQKKNELQYKIIKDEVFRVFAGEEDTSMLSRYGIIEEGEESRLCDGKGNTAGTYTFHASEGDISVSGERSALQITAIQKERGFEILIPLSEKDRLYGLGDSAKGNVMRRGTTARMFIRNVVGYGPIPYVMSSEGWAVL